MGKILADKGPDGKKMRRRKKELEKGPPMFYNL